jgi:hypothetical protein
MALPKLNEIPKYDLVIPSLNETVRFRPFLVKEQKVLMLGYESQNKKEILKAIIETIDACVSGDVDLNRLTTYDVDYMFTKIRAKSVGETADIQISCSNCQEMNDVKVNLDSIEVKDKKETNTVKLTDEISVKLRHPTYNYFMTSSTFFTEGRSETDMTMDLIVSCLDSVLTEEEAIKISDESHEEVLAFVDSLSTSQFELITKWVENMPSLQTEIKFKCKHCDTENTKLLKGLDDFF